MDEDCGIVKRSGRTCKVCESGLVKEVDRRLTLSVSQAQIARWMNEQVGKEVFTRQNIQDHAKRHLRIDDEVLDQMIEQKRADHKEELTYLVEKMMQVDETLEYILQKGVLRMVNDELEVGVKDLIEVCKLLRDRNDRLEQRINENIEAEERGIQFMRTVQKALNKQAALGDNDGLAG